MPRAVSVGIALTVISAFAFGSGALFAKPAYEAGLGWHVLMAWRFLLGAGLAWLWVAARPGSRRGLLGMSRRSILVAVALGVLYSGNSSTYFAGLETVSASLAALIVYIYPALVAVLSLRIGRRLEGRRAWASLGLALAGVALAAGAAWAAAVSKAWTPPRPGR
jgi:drug/metabolite transporter (DMT)-like permease